MKIKYKDTTVAADLTQKLIESNLSHDLANKTSLLCKIYKNFYGLFYRVQIKLL